MDDHENRIQILERQVIHAVVKIDEIKTMMSELKKFLAGASFVFAVIGAVATMIVDQVLRH